MTGIVELSIPLIMNGMQLHWWTPEAPFLVAFKHHKKSQKMVILVDLSSISATELFKNDWHKQSPQVRQVYFEENS